MRTPRKPHENPREPAESPREPGRTWENLGRELGGYQKLTVKWSGDVDSELAVERLLDNGVNWLGEEVAQGHWLLPVVQQEPAHSLLVLSWKED